MIGNSGPCFTGKGTEGRLRAAPLYRQNSPSAEIQFTPFRNPQAGERGPGAQELADPLKEHSVGHETYISFKAEDHAYKTEIQSWPHLDYVNRSLDTPIESNDADYILRKIREDYLRGSTVTVFLIGSRSAEDLGSYEQQYIKGELQASLYSGGENWKSGILGVVLPEMHATVYGGSSTCHRCGESHHTVRINDSTVIREFSQNYYIPGGAQKCSWSEEDRYCVLASWDEFSADPNGWIDKAYAKRDSPIAEKTRVRP